METSNAFSWSLGVRATVCEWGCTTFGMEAQYFRVRPHVKRVTFGDLVSDYPGEGGDDKYEEWQVAAALSRRINFFVPYVGWTWSRARWSFNNIVSGTTESVHVDIENSREWGLAIGTSLLSCERIAVTVEGRFINEKALYVNGNVRF